MCIRDRYLPFEKTDKQIEQEILSVEKNRIETTLPAEIREELIVTYLPIIKQQLDNLDIDKTIALIKNLEEYNSTIQIAEITEFCTQLTGYVQSFNVVKMNFTLMQLFKYINN